MLRHATHRLLSARLQALDEARQGDTEAISTEFPNVGISCKKRYQTFHPELGLIHTCNEICAPLIQFCVKHRNYHGRSHGPAVPLTAELTHALSAVRFQPCTAEQRAGRSKIGVLLELYRDPDFLQIDNFLSDFRAWIEGRFRTDGGGGAGGAATSASATPDVGAASAPPANPAAATPAPEPNPLTYLEPFQRNLLLHVIFFIATSKLPTLANRVVEFLQHVFNLDFLSTQAVQLFKQKVTVFLVPRRHGKTWFTIPIICFLLKNIVGISVGYVAHQKHVSQFVLKAVEFNCRRMFGHRFTVENKDNVVSIDHTAAKSTALFASCYNTNSVRGQNFHLLIVDEAHFIKKDAFNTILGFLAQHTCKIIFISSTNTTNDATCFLTRLNSAPFDMLNVVSYVCEEHLNAFSERSDATACPCYRLHKPTFITINPEVRRTANLFLAGSFMDEIMGGTTRVSDDTVLITDESRDEFDILRYSTQSLAIRPHLGTFLCLYLDPAFTSNRRASGTGIAAIGLFREQYIVYGLEHFFLKDLLQSSETAIAECAAHMLVAILSLHPFLTEVRVALEGNSNQAAAVRIACILKQLVCAERRVDLRFYHTLDQNEIRQPFYLMGREKRLAVESFIAKFNSGYIKASQELVSHTIKLSHDPVDYFLDQLKNIHRVTLNEHVFTYSAKKNHAPDDLVIALIMSVYLCQEQFTLSFQPI